LWFFFIEEATFVQPKPEKSHHHLAEVTDINRIGNSAFMSNATKIEKQLFQEWIDNASVTLGPGIELVVDPNDPTRAKSVFFFFLANFSMVDNNNNNNIADSLSATVRALLKDTSPR
jgi:hypothetical protein